MSNITKFAAWRPKAKERLERLGFSVSYFDSPPSMNSSMRLDFKNEILEATLIVWEFGDVVPEAYSLGADQFIDVERKDLSDDGLEVLLDDYLDQILKAGMSNERRAE